MKSIGNVNTSLDKKEKITLRDYYKSLPEANEIAPRKLLVKRIAERCNVPESTARSWFAFGVKPRDNKDQVIAILSEETGIDPKDMWEN